MATFIVDIYWPLPGGPAWPEDTARAVEVQLPDDDTLAVEMFEAAEAKALASLTPAERDGAVVGTVREVLP